MSGYADGGLVHEFVVFLGAIGVVLGVMSGAQLLVKGEEFALVVLAVVFEAISEGLTDGFGGCVRTVDMLDEPF